MANDNLNTSQAIATIALFLMLLVPVAVALAWWFKRRYTRAVIRLQTATAGSGAAPAGTLAPAAAAPAASIPPLHITVRRADEVANASTASPRRLRRRALGVQFVTGLFYWWALLLFVIVALLFGSGNAAGGIFGAGIFV